MSTITQARTEGPASLSMLPRKLKERIAAELNDLALYLDDDKWEDASSSSTIAPDEIEGGQLDDDEADDDEFVLVESPDDQRVSTLAAVSLVNKEWNEIVSRYLWEDLRLYPRSTESLLQLATYMLPRHAAHVKTLGIRETPYDPLLEGADAEDAAPAADGRALEVVEAVERLTGSLAPISGDWELRQLAARNGLLAHIVRVCSNVKGLELEGGLRIFRRLYAAEDVPEMEPVEATEAELPNVALQAVQSIGGNIETLSLLLPLAGTVTERDVASLVSFFPHLKHLELNVFIESKDVSSPADQLKREALYTAIAGLQHLEELDLGQSTFVDDAVSEVAFACPLKHLALGEHPKLSFRAFKTFVERFSGTLESLELDNTPSALLEEIDEPLALPKLIALELATTLDASIFTLFAASPIREVYIRESPQLTAKDVIGFLEAHAETLEAVDVEEDGLAASEEGSDGAVQDAEEVVGEWCEERGIKFAVIESEELGEFDLASDSDEEDAEQDADE
ncbi:hypothetical protein Rhopal_001950-T1 [Rhodotorula paludigena]|uniref:F-box domain-containing protein n=1 Tax=Rhodotorula paludigena TaxID=86838 RepID=A0AAV5GGI0_9BASI|nr:hypothetical protein Rhopal_001950-T1 [Rhodotorula paludigena]